MFQYMFVCVNPVNTGRKFTISAKKAPRLRCFCGKRGYRCRVCNQEVAGSNPAGSTGVSYWEYWSYRSSLVDPG